VPRVLETLSRLLETTRPLLTVDDLGELADGERGALEGTLVLVPTKAARSVACDACHADHVEEVTRDGDTTGEVTFRILCPHAGWVLVPAERLRQWTVDVPKLVSLLGEGLGGGQSPEVLVGDRIWRIGTIGIAGEQFAVVLARNHSDYDDPLLHKAVREALRPRTILVGTCDLPDAEGYAAAVSLPLAFRLDEGRFVFQPDRIRSVLRLETNLKGNVFLREGDNWQVSFEGLSRSLMDRVGFAYLAHLLGHPFRDIPAVVLWAIVKCIDPRVASGPPEGILDQIGFRKLESRYRELQDAIDDAEQKNKIELSAGLKAERERLGEEFANAMGFGGRGRKWSTAYRVQNSVSMAVSRAIEHVGKKHAPLGRHLHAFITSGFTFQYAPVPPVDWFT
jgi:hypothetical protein